MKKFIFVLIAGTAAMSAAQAQQTQTLPRYYLGAGIATVDHKYSISGASNVDSDGYKVSGKVFGGYEFDETWGAEAGYTNYRKSRASFIRNGAAGRVESDGYSVYAAGKAALPIDERISVYGKLGVVYTKTDLSSATVGLGGDESDTSVYGAVGVQYNVNPQVALIAEYERYGKSRDFGAKPDVWTVGARYSF